MNSTTGRNCHILFAMTFPSSPLFLITTFHLTHYDPFFYLRCYKNKEKKKYPFITREIEIFQALPYVIRLRKRVSRGEEGRDNFCVSLRVVFNTPLILHGWNGRCEDSREVSLFWGREEEELIKRAIMHAHCVWLWLETEVKGGKSGLKGVRVSALHPKFLEKPVLRRKHLSPFIVDSVEISASMDYRYYSFPSLCFLLCFYELGILKWRITKYARYRELQRRGKSV